VQFRGVISVSSRFSTRCDSQVSETEQPIAPGSTSESVRVARSVAFDRPQAKLEFSVRTFLAASKKTLSAPIKLGFSLRSVGDDSFKASLSH
jgi:hypothetical protein